MVTARSDNIFTGACSPKKGTIYIGIADAAIPKTLDPRGTDPEHQAIYGELPTELRE
jgi:hypothetical protein